MSEPRRPRSPVQIYVDLKTKIVKKVLGVESVPTPRQVGHYLKAVTSGQATPEVVAARFAECLVCPKLITDGDHRWCGGNCGCGKRPEAELTIKLAYAFAHCPLGRPGFSNSVVAQ